MVDTTQPSSPQEFIAAGATPEQAALLHEQHETMAGRRGFDAKVAMSLATEDAPPLPTPPPPVSRVSQAQATASLEAHTQAQLSAQLAADFAPPASPQDYRLPPPPDRDLTDEEFAQESAIKTAFHSEGVPRWLGENVAASMVEGFNTLERMTPEQAADRLAKNVASLKSDRLWGKDYDSNLATLDTLLAQMNGRHPALGLASNVRLTSGRDVPLLELLDPLTVDSLLQFALHRGRR
jgi:hypothetical protein